MPEEARIALPVLLASLVTTAAILLLGWTFGRRGAVEQRGRWALPLALGLGFAAAFAVIAQWRGIQLAERWHWLLPMAMSAMVLGIITAVWRSSSIIQITAIALVMSAVGGLLFHPPPIVEQPWMWKAGLAALILVSWMNLEGLAARRGGVSLPVCLVIVFGGLSFVLVESRQAGFSLLAAGMAAALGVAVVFALRNRNLCLASGAMFVVATVFTGLLAVGWLYSGSEIGAALFVLILIAPAAMWIGELSIVRRMKPWQAMIVRAAVVGAPVLVAAALAMRAIAGGDSEM